MDNRFIDACRNGNVEIVKKLINGGYTYSNNGHGAILSALMNACINNHIEVVRVLLETNNAHPEYRSPTAKINLWGGKNALTIACIKGHVEIVTTLLKTGRANPGNQDDQGWTALMYVCDCIYTKSELVIVTALLHSGQAHPELKNNKGDDALAIARKRNHTDIVDILLVDILSGLKHASK